MSLLDEVKAVKPGYNGVNPWVVEDEVENFETVSDEHTGKSRWYSTHTAVFWRDNDETPYVALDYTRPLTEVQDGQDFDDAKVYEVEPYDVVVTKYREV